MKRVCDFFRKYSHIWLLSYFFIYIPWFCYLEKTVTRDYHLMHAPLDSLIPFNEYFIIPYLLWFASLLKAKRIITGCAPFCFQA